MSEHLIFLLGCDKVRHGEKERHFLNYVDGESGISNSRVQTVAGASNICTKVIIRRKR